MGNNWPDARQNLRWSYLNLITFLRLYLSWQLANCPVEASALECEVWSSSFSLCPVCRWISNSELSTFMKMQLPRFWNMQAAYATLRQRKENVSKTIILSAVNKWWWDRICNAFRCKSTSLKRKLENYSVLYLEECVPKAEIYDIFLWFCPIYLSWKMIDDSSLSICS